jgi:epoxyqueuosine reductase
MNYPDEIKSRALQLGFDLVGITDASPISQQQIELLSNWLTRGCAGRMDFMHRNFKMRIDPSRHLQDAQSVICVALNYHPAKPCPPPASSKSPIGVVADYALYEDYHQFMKKKLRELVAFISTYAGSGFKFKICVDSSPLAERALAARAGLGFIGKNRILINPALGPQLFLAEIITNLELQPDKPTLTSQDCSNCNSCIAACPMGALQGDGLLDAANCINYLTIEHKGQIPSELACKFANHLVGCDECVHVCPYYQKALPCRNSSFKFYPDRAYLDLHQLLNMSQADFDTKLADLSGVANPSIVAKAKTDSPLTHVGLERLKRNARICLNNITH